MKKAIKKSAVVILLLLIPVALFSQEQNAAESLTLDRAISMALESNTSVKNARLNLEIAEKLKKASFNLPAPSVFYEYGQNNSTLKDRYINIEQSFEFPTVYTSRNKFHKQSMQLATTQQSLEERRIASEVKAKYFDWLASYSLLNLAKEEDSIYREFLYAVKLKYKTGEINLLTESVAETNAMKIEQKLSERELNLAKMEQELHLLLKSGGRFTPAENFTEKLPLPAIVNDSVSESIPQLMVYKDKATLMDAAVKAENMKFLPDISVGYFNQTIDHATGFNGWRVGITVPIWFWSQSGKVQATKIQREVEMNNLDFAMMRVQSEFQKHIYDMNHYRKILEGYEQKTLGHIDIIINNSYKNMIAGELTYFEYVLSISHAYNLLSDYVDALNKYNQSVIKIEALTEN